MFTIAADRTILTSFTFIIVVLGCSCVQASGPVLPMDDSVEKADLAGFVQILKERDGPLSIGQVSSPEFSRRFEPAARTNHGFVQEPFWLRFSVENRERQTITRLLEISFPFLDEITLYEPEPDGSFKSRTTGRALPFDVRDVKHRNFVFHLHLRPGTQTYYVRIATESAMYFPMQLWEEHAFWKADHDSQFLLGQYYGVMVVMALYNLFIFFSLKDSSYLFYVMYITFFCLYQMTANGLAYEYLWPDAVWWNRHSTLFLAGGAMLWAVLFTRHFLSTAKAVPALDRILCLLAFFSVGLALSSLVASYGFMLKVTLAAAALFVMTMLLTGSVCWIKGQRSARFFLLAWLAILAGVMAMILWNVGVLPTRFLSVYGIQIGSVMDVVLLSLALADRINELRLAREEAMQEAMDQRAMAERQREAMVRELHDGIGAIATNIGMLARKASMVACAGEIERDLETISELADRGRMEIATFMDCLDEGNLDARAFVSDLRFLANQILRPNGISFAVDDDMVQEDVELSPFVRVSVTKIFQEALTNIVKHSRAERARIVMSVDNRRLRLVICDDGMGRYGEERPREGGRGLSSMKKRAENLGGSLEIRTDGGFEIVLEVPVAQGGEDTRCGSS